MGEQEETFFIGELAARSGSSRDTIRYYESNGVLPDPRRSGSGYRIYRPADVERLTFVAQAKGLGLTLDEIADTLKIVDEGREPCAHVRDALRGRLIQTRARIDDLKALEARLQNALGRAQAVPHDSEVPAGGACRCPIIEDVAGGTG